MSKQVIAVVMGGPSMEHEVSMNSGQAVLDNLDASKYEVIKVVVSKDEEWFFADETVGLNLKPALERLKAAGATVFIALHGTYGEDGVLQALFERRGIPHTGSDVIASDLAMNKLASNERYAAHDLLVPKTLAFKDGDADIKTTILANFSFPLVVKPVSEGSSVGVHIMKSAAGLDEAVADAQSSDNQIMVQEYIAGREVTCGVVQHGDKLAVLPPTEIIPLADDFYSYKAKYTEGGSRHVTPAELPEEIIETIQTNAVTAHGALGCKTYSRTDMIVNDTGIYIIETNTLPGLTQYSLLPEQAKVAGLSFAELLDLIIAGAEA